MERGEASGDGKQADADQSAPAPAPARPGAAGPTSSCGLMQAGASLEGGPMEAAPGPGQHAWDRFMLWWHYAFAVTVQPDVVLMDLRMPGTDGVEAGAKGYLLKDTPRSELIRAVRAAAVGGTVLAPVVAAELLGRSRASAVPELTGREVEVLALVAAGKTNAETGQALFIGEATVKAPTCSMPLPSSASTTARRP